MKRILLIGGAGFIGSNLINHLHKVFASKIYIIEPETANLTRLNNIKKSFTLIKLDIKNINDISNVIIKNKIDIVIHLVATLLPGSTLKDYQNEMNDILMPSINIMQICSKNNVLFVYLSSGGTVYGNGSKDFKESASLNPISYYGLSKVFMEQAILCENYLSNLDYLILRPSNPFGSGQYIFGEQGLIAISIGKVLIGEPIKIWGDGSLIRDYIHIDDLCYYISSLLYKNIKNEIINIGSGKGYSVKKIINLIQDVVGKSIEISTHHSRKTDVKSVILNIEKLNNLVPKNKNTDFRSQISNFYKNELKKFNENRNFRK